MNFDQVGRQERANEYPTYVDGKCHDAQNLHAMVGHKCRQKVRRTSRNAFCRTAGGIVVGRPFNDCDFRAVRARRPS